MSQTRIVKSCGWLVDQRAEGKFGLWWARTGVRGENALWKNSNVRNRGVTAQAICGWRIGEGGAAITGEFEGDLNRSMQHLDSEYREEEPIDYKV